MPAEVGNGRQLCDGVSAPKHELQMKINEVFHVENPLVRSRKLFGADPPLGSFPRETLKPHFPKRSTWNISVERWLACLCNSLSLQQNALVSWLHRNRSLQMHHDSGYSAERLSDSPKTKWDASSRLPTRRAA